jgi:CelD/BcsL family acetyltransferase involved in cellulose biosynthesis
MTPGAASVADPEAVDLAAISLASDNDAPEWDAFVDGHPHATGYHVWAWRGVFIRAFGHEPIYLIARQDGRIVGVLPLV